MAGIVSNDASRRETFEGTPSFNSIGGGAGAGKELVTFFQGGASGSRKVTSSSQAGFYIDDLVSPRIDISDPVGTLSPLGYPNPEFIPGCVVMAKAFLSDGQDVTSGGFRFLAGPNLAHVILADDDSAAHPFVKPYPPLQSWLITPWVIVTGAKPNYARGLSQIAKFTESSSGYQQNVSAWGVSAALTAGGAKSENIFLDSVDVSDGLYLVGGTVSPDSPAVLQDFIDYDEGTIGNRFGHCTTREEIIYWLGRMIIGRSSPLASPASTAQATIFTDENKVVVFPNHLAYSGWAVIEIDISDPGTVVNFTNMTITGRGSGRKVIKFNRNTDVSATTDRITLTDLDDMDYNDGDSFFYDPLARDGVVSGTRLAVSFDVEKKGVYLIRDPGNPSEYQISWWGTTWSDAYNATASALSGQRMALNNGSDSPEQIHSLVYDDDFRPDLIVTADASPSGSFNINAGTYENFRYWNLQPGVSVSDANIIGISNIDVNGATLENCVIADSVVLDAGLAILDTDSLDNIQNCEIAFPTNPNGALLNVHAIRVTVPGTYTFTGNTFTGSWGANGSDTAMILNDSGGLVTINVADGDTVTYKNAPGSPENSTVVNANVNVTLTDIVPGTEVRVYPVESPINTTEIAGIESTGSPSEFTFSAGAGSVVDIVVLHVDYVLAPDNRIRNYTVPNTSTAFPINQLLDRNYLNP